MGFDNKVNPLEWALLIITQKMNKNPAFTTKKEAESIETASFYIVFGIF